MIKTVRWVPVHSSRGSLENGSWAVNGREFKVASMSQYGGEAAKWALAETAGPLSLPHPSALAPGVPKGIAYPNGLPYTNGSGAPRVPSWQGIRLPTIAGQQDHWQRPLSSGTAQPTPYLSSVTTSHPWLPAAHYQPQTQKLPHASAFSPRGMAQQQEHNEYDAYQQQRSAMQQQQPPLRSPNQPPSMLMQSSPQEFLPPNARLTQPPGYGDMRLMQQQQQQHMEQQQRSQLGAGSFWPNAGMRPGLGLPTTSAMETAPSQISPNTRNTAPTPPGLLNVQLPASNNRLAVNGGSNGTPSQQPSAVSPQYQQISPPLVAQQSGLSSAECAITTTQETSSQDSLSAGCVTTSAPEQTMLQQTDISGLTDQGAVPQPSSCSSPTRDTTTVAVQPDSGAEVSTTTEEPMLVEDCTETTEIQVAPESDTKDDVAPKTESLEAVPAECSDNSNSSQGAEGPLVISDQPASSFQERALSTASMSSLASATELNRAAALRLEEKIMNEAMGITRPTPSILSPPLTRPPGLGPPPVVTMTSPLGPDTPGGLAVSTGPTVYTCPICGFSSASKFHFNSHMNTHTDHQCSMCDYTSRTEGRLKRHMKEFHSAEEQAAAGMSPDLSMRVEPPPTMAPQPPSIMDNQQLSALEQMQALTRKPEAMPLPSTSMLGDMAGDDQNKRGATGGSKPKNYKCKQCGHVSRSKEESWAHARTHIPPEKQLTCPKCEFVTEYKHHLEYHLRNHFGSKPFQCKKCNYSCVNKSMLNSHMKSHSNFYQYRCSDCTYATKYCHSLKLHLRKYAHRPATVITADGSTIDPTQLDLYGNGRRSAGKKKDSSPTPGAMGFGDQMPPSFVGTTLASQLPLIQANLLVQQQQRQQIEAVALAQRMALGSQMPLPLQEQFPSSSANPESDLATKCQLCPFRSTNRQEMYKHISQHVQPELANMYGLGPPTMVHPTGSMDDPASVEGVSEEQVSDEQPSAGNSPVTGEGSHMSSGSPISGKGSGDESGNGDQPQGSSRRKGKAFKLDQISKRLQGKLSPTHSGSSGAQDEQEQMDTSRSASGTVEETPKSESSAIRREPQSLVPRYQKTEGVTATSNTQEAYMMALTTAFQMQQQRRTDAERSQTGTETTEQPQLPFTCTHYCQHCKIAFHDAVMYTIHSSYHNYDNPFKCNRCGHLNQDSLSFSLHLLQAKHE